MLGDVKDNSCGMELPVDYQHYASKHFDYGKGVYISAITLLHGLWHKGTRASERASEMASFFTIEMVLFDR